MIEQPESLEIRAVLFLLSTSMNPQIFLSTAFPQQNMLRLDVLAKDLPNVFLGTAFDLVVPEQWTFDHEELCGVFDPADRHVLHLVSSKPGRVVFGLAITGGGYDDPRDGCLVSFYFHVPNHDSGSISFEHHTMSVYQNGRRDVASVSWKGIDASVSKVPSESPTDAKTMETFSQQVAVTQQAGFLGEDDLLRSIDPQVADVYIVVLSFLLLGLIVFGLSLAYFRLKDKK